VIWPESVHWAHFTGRDSVWLLPDLGHIPDDVAGVVVVGEQNLATVRVPVLQFRPLPLVVGVGCNRNTSASEIRDMLDRVLEETGMDLSRIRCVATVDLKQDEVGLVTFAAEGGWPVQFFSVAQLKSIPVPSPSATVQTVIGTSSVSEAAALLSGGGRLLVSKQKSGNVTLAVATWAKG